MPERRNGGYPYWGLNGADNRPACGVLLSGAYDFSDRTFPDITGQSIDDFNNYTDTVCPADQLRNPATGVAISPSELVQPESNQSFMPVFLANSLGDSVPFRQILDIQCKFQENNISTAKYEAHTTHTRHHSFKLWQDRDVDNGGSTISAESITFLQTNLGEPQKQR